MGGRERSCHNVEIYYQQMNTDLPLHVCCGLIATYKFVERHASVCSSYIVYSFCYNPLHLAMSVCGFSSVLLWKVQKVAFASFSKLLVTYVLQVLRYCRKWLFKYIRTSNFRLGCTCTCASNVSLQAKLTLTMYHGMKHSEMIWRGSCKLMRDCAIVRTERVDEKDEVIGTIHYLSCQHFVCLFMECH